MKFSVDSTDTDRIKKYADGMLEKMHIKESIEIEYDADGGIGIQRPIIHKNTGEDIHMMYKGYMMLHLSSGDPKDADAVCYAIEIMEEMERSGYPIWEKGIYQGAYKKYPPGSVQ